jgi:hypothetical protein
MKFVKLLTAAHVGGTLRHPNEGVLHIEDDEARRLIDNEAAEDVSGDFTAKQDRETPTEAIATASGGEEPAQPEHPHQAEVAPQAAPASTPSRRARGSQE